MMAHQVELLIPQLMVLLVMQLLLYLMALLVEQLIPQLIVLMLEKLILQLMVFLVEQLMFLQVNLLMVILVEQLILQLMCFNMGLPTNHQRLNSIRIRSRISQLWALGTHTKFDVMLSMLAWVMTVSNKECSFFW